MRDKPRDKQRKMYADDFTRIPGVPAFANKALHGYGVMTFAQLRAADLSWLHAPVREAIEGWRGG